MIKILSVAILTVALSSCVANRQKSVTSFQSVCSNYGFVAGTNAHAKCMQTESLAARQRSADQKRKRDCAMRNAQVALKPYTGYSTSPTSMGAMLGSLGQSMSGC
jgi:hypothetical protein